MHTRTRKAFEVLGVQSSQLRAVSVLELSYIPRPTSDSIQHTLVQRLPAVGSKLLNAPTEDPLLTPLRSH